MMRTTIRMTGIALLAFSVTACGSKPEPQRKAADAYQEGDGFSLRRMVGVTKTAPDEFAVISSKPLQMPTDFAALPPPDPGARSALVADPVAEARGVLLGGTAPTPASTRISSSEGALLAATGASDPSIRATLAAEQAELDSVQNTYLLDRVFPSLRTYRGEDLKDSIRPAEERARLSALRTGPVSYEPGEIIATLPSAPATPSAPAQARPVIDTVTTGAQAPVDPTAGGELIFIPE